MLRVIDIQDGTAVVSTVGLLRVMIEPEHSIFEELVAADRAAQLVEEFNACFPSRKFWAEALDYTEVRRRDLNPAPAG